MEIRKLFKQYNGQLRDLYPPQESESLVLWLFEHFLGIKRMAILEGIEVEIPPSLKDAMVALKQGMPIQYITQSAPFYGRMFKVNPAVLIPRNETEELVHLIIRENKGAGLKILDVGTGSGCIPITLALEMDTPEITAIDVSEDALRIARENSAALVVDKTIRFLKIDVLQEEFPITGLDILVSNPPYVRESEKDAMHVNVLDYEPHLALFVRDEDPLIFYLKIAEKGIAALKSGGKIYFEINEALGEQVVELLSRFGYQNAQIHKDLNDRNRIVSAVR